MSATARCRKIERKYGMGIRGVVAELYSQHNVRLADVAAELSVTRATLYNWIPPREIAMIRAQSNMHDPALDGQFTGGVSI